MPLLQRFFHLPGPHHQVAGGKQTDETIAMEKSPLGRLPPELRLEIFEYVFTYERLACNSNYWSVARKGERKYRPLSKQLGATLVCKQMRKETLHLPFSLNTLVCGNEVGDFDPYYEYWIAPSLKTPCTWAYNALRRLMHVLSDSTTLKLHLWIYPAMSEQSRKNDTEWAELSKTFAELVSVLGPAKLAVTLHFHFHFENLRCEYLDSSPLMTHSETMFEIQAGRSTAEGGSMLLDAMVECKHEEIQLHERHQQYDHCPANLYTNMLSMQLVQAEQAARKFMSLAMQASNPSDTLSDMSEPKDDVPLG